mgnify:CR=1 FL=1
MLDMTKLQQMKDDIKKILLGYEYKIPAINGVTNLTASDLEYALLRIDMLKTGNKYRLMKVNNEVKALFNSYGIDPEYNNVCKFL